MKGLTLIISTVATLVLVSCASTTTTSDVSSRPPSPPEPRNLLLDGEVVQEDEVGGITSWECEDFDEGGPTLVEVGFFGDSAETQRRGFILYDGGDTGSYASYERAGLDKRWEWGTNGNDYAFEISPDGTGEYFELSDVSDNDDNGDAFQALPPREFGPRDDRFKCSRK